MATVQIIETFEDREGGANVRFERNYKRKFWAVTDDPKAGPGEVGNASGVPRLGDPYFSLLGGVDPQAIASEIRVKQRNEGPCHWTVEIDYTNKFESSGKAPGQGSDGQGEHRQPDPTKRSPELRWGTNKVQKAVQATAEDDPDPGLGGAAKKGSAITNSAGDPFDPPPEREESRLTLHVVANQLTFDPIVIFTLVNTVNSKPWKGFPERCARCTSVAADLQFESGIFFWKVTYEFEMRADTWDLRPLDAGYNELVDVEGTERKRVILINTKPATKPVLLNGNGGQKGPDIDPFYRKFRIYPSIDFNPYKFF